MAELFSKRPTPGESAKLLYLASNGDTKRYKTTKERNENEVLTKEVLDTFREALTSKSMNPVNNLLRKRIKDLKNATYSKECHNLKWKRKNDFMAFIETIKYLGLETDELLEKEEDVMEKCGMDFIKHNSQIFLCNENLVIGNICDMLTNEQTILFWKEYMRYCDLLHDGKQLEAFDENSFSENDLQIEGMKETLFLYIIRSMEVKGKVNRLYTDIFIDWLTNIKKESNNNEKLDKALQSLETYKIVINPPGYCLLICMMDDREGAKAEKDNLEHIFKNLLGYKVKTLIDPLREDINTAASNCVNMPQLEMYDSFICWFVGHGQKEKIMLKDEEISREEFLQLFSKQEGHFSKKPKIFFMASCQGPKLIPVPRLFDGHPAERDGVIPSVLKTIVFPEAVKDIETVHSQSDRYVAYATLPDHLAARDLETGSVFVSTICKLIEDYPGSSINDIMQKTTRKIHQIVFNTDTLQGVGKQACYSETTLQKRFYFPLPVSLAGAATQRR